MTIGINKVILVGFVGDKPKQFTFTNGNTSASFSLATTKAWKTNKGELGKDTQWHQIMCYGEIVHNVCKFLNKGNLCYLEGELKTSHWQDKHQINRQKTQIILKKFRCLDRPAHNPGQPSLDTIPPPSMDYQDDLIADW